MAQYSDIQKACMGLIKHLGRPAAHHAIYAQTRVNRATGGVKQVIMVHRHPDMGADLVVPASFAGFPVEDLAWPVAEL